MTSRSQGGLAAVALLAAQVVLLAFALSDADEAARPPTLPISPAAPPLEPLTVETALPLTDPVARAWDQDAVLISAMMEVVWDRDVEIVVPTAIAGGGAMTLVYAAGDAQLSLQMDRRSGVIFDAEVGTWSEALFSALPVSAIARSSSIAVLSAEVSYGTSYRAACPDHRFVTRVYLTKSADNNAVPIWLVSYVDERHRDRPDIQIAVDAATGTTVDGRATAIGCEEE